MAFLRSIKTKDILNSDQRTEYLRDKNLYITAKNSGSNRNFIQNKAGCLIAVDSYQNRINISKGHNLVISQCNFKTDSIDPIPVGKLNEGNFLQANLTNNKIINSETKNLSGQSNINNNILLSDYNVDNQLYENDPLTPPWTTNQSRGPLSQFTRWDSSGVFIDPNRIYINKNSCKNLIYLKDPKGNNYYDISNNHGSQEDLIEIIRNNTRLTNYSLTSKISLKNYPAAPPSPPSAPRSLFKNNPCRGSSSSRVPAHARAVGDSGVSEHGVWSLGTPVDTPDVLAHLRVLEVEEPPKKIQNDYITQITDVAIIDCNNNLSVVLNFKENGKLISSLSFSSSMNVKKGPYTMQINPLPNGTYQNESVTLTTDNNITTTLILKYFTVNNC